MVKYTFSFALLILIIQNLYQNTIAQQQTIVFAQSTAAATQPAPPPPTAMAQMGEFFF